MRLGGFQQQVSRQAGGHATNFLPLAGAYQLLDSQRNFRDKTGK